MPVTICRLEPVINLQSGTVAQCLLNLLHVNLDLRLIIWMKQGEELVGCHLTDLVERIAGQDRVLPIDVDVSSLLEVVDVDTSD